jgi:hypothetical protein
VNLCRLADFPDRLIFLRRQLALSFFIGYVGPDVVTGVQPRLHHNRKLKQHLCSMLRGNSGDHQVKI